MLLVLAAIWGSSFMFIKVAVGELAPGQVAFWRIFVGAVVLLPFAGAVLGKIAILVLIILFIQKRPRGLFALKGRAVEA